MQKHPITQGQGAPALGYCGPTALTYALSVYGIWISRYQARKACGVSRTRLVTDGCEVEEMIQGVVHYGMTARTCTKQNAINRLLLSHCKKGFTAVVGVDSYDMGEKLGVQNSHWVAVVGYDEDSCKLIVCDPNSGHRYRLVTVKELERRARNSDEKKVPYEVVLLVPLVGTKVEKMTAKQMKRIHTVVRERRVTNKQKKVVRRVMGVVAVVLGVLCA